MVEFLQILAVVVSGLFAAEAFLCSHESKAERKQKRDGEQWVRERCGKTY